MRRTWSATWWRCCSSAACRIGSVVGAPACPTSPSAALPETVRQPPPSQHRASWRPRVGVPREVRAAFVAPALAGIATFAIGGYYAALVPGLLAERLGLASPLISGAIVAALYGIAAG